MKKLIHCLEARDVEVHGQGGLARSVDGGATWSGLPFDGKPAAIAVTAQGQTIGIVTQSTEFFRSDDGGQTWPAP